MPADLALSMNLPFVGVPSIATANDADPGATPDTAIVYHFPKNSRELVVAGLRHYRGSRLADLRVCVPSTSGGMLFTAKGLSLTVDQLPQLEAAVRALRVAVDAGASASVPASEVAP